MNKKCHSCPIAAICIERDGPDNVGLAKCAACSTVFINTSQPTTPVLLPVPHWDCWRNYIIFRDFKQQAVISWFRCTFCRRREVGWLKFLIS